MRASNITKGSLLAALLVATTVSSRAATISLPSGGFYLTAVLDLPEATLKTSNGIGFTVGFLAGGTADSFCFSPLEGSCAADGEILFKSVVNSLMFDVGGFASGDSVKITAFNNSSPVGDISVAGNGVVDFSSFGPITRLFFDDSSDAASGGVSYSDFSFSSSTVPEPGTLALLGLGLAGLAAARRHRRRQ